MSHIDHLLDMLDARELPDPCPDGVPCCDAYAVFGPARCTCWTIECDVDQQPAHPELPHDTRTRMCTDCAFRPGSPERTDSPRAVAGSEQLMDCVYGTAPFYCHDGLRRGVAYVHPNGLRVVPEIVDGVVPYQPLMVDGRPYQADGTPALHCAGLTAARRAKDWTP